MDGKLFTRARNALQKIGKGVYGGLEVEAVLREIVQEEEDRRRAEIMAQVEEILRKPNFSLEIHTRPGIDVSTPGHNAYLPGKKTIVIREG